MAQFDAPALAGSGNTRVKISGTPVIPVTILGVGLYLAWFGVHYWRSGVKWPSDPVKAVLTGKPLPDNTAAAPGAGVPASALPVGGLGAVMFPPSASDTAAVAQAALKYQGAGYSYGGRADVPGNWDCSSFVSYVLGKDLGLVLPGGGKFGDIGYPPNAHGPGSTAYMLYGLGVDASQVQAGDLVVSIEHIGIAISPTQMISAQEPSTGTRVSGFPAGFPSGPPVYRRVPVNLFHAG
jgi:hypothetical protein